MGHIFLQPHHTQLLRGKVADVNTPFLCRSLHSMGWAVMRVSVLPDDVAAISQELRTCAKVCIVCCYVLCIVCCYVHALYTHIYLGHTHALHTPMPIHPHPPQAYDVVITAGGIGPTLDDVTMTAVADALSVHLIRCVMGE